MKKILGSLFILCFAFSANAQLLWKISGNGLTQPSYVMGTHHLAALSIKDSIQGLQAALVRIENKTYGICRETGKLIPAERLRAVPHATLSIEAKNSGKK